MNSIFFTDIEELSEYALGDAVILGQRNFDPFNEENLPYEDDEEILAFNFDVDDEEEDELNGLEELNFEE